MEPYKANKLPQNIELSKDILKLLCEANENYGEYKGYLKSMKFDYKCLLESLFVNDLYYSFKIDNAKLTKEDMFYMPYKNKTNEVLIFNNLKKSLYYCIANTIQNGIDTLTINKMHKLMYEGCPKTNNTKGSGHYRKKQAYLLKPGIAGSSVSFIPVVYQEITDLMKNLCEYYNSHEDVGFISSALTHIQFERIHPYNSGNGKLGRLLIPIQISHYKKETPILFMSESMDNLKNTYYNITSSMIDNNIDIIKFFLQCIINQCQLNIKKIKKLNKVYQTDYESFKKNIGGTTIYKVYPIIIKKIVFTTNDIVLESNLHINSVNKVLNKLVESGYLIKEKKKGTNRVTFKYKNMYDVFVD